MTRRETEIGRSQEASESGNERDRSAGAERETPSGTATDHSNNEMARAERTAEGDSESASDERPVPLDQVFEMLRNHRRRRVFRILTKTAQIEIGDLAEEIAARELDKPRSQLTSQERKRLYVALYQAHLPKLAGIDAITYDKRQGLVGPGPTLDSFTTHLPDESESARTETEEGGWREYIPNILK